MLICEVPGKRVLGIPIIVDRDGDIAVTAQFIRCSASMTSIS